jgi:hypothetical protein
MENQMSAFICDDLHINAIVTYAIDKKVSFYNPTTKTRTDITATNAEAIGRMLMDENVRSVCHRYSDAGDDEKSAAAQYKFKRFATPLTAVEVIKACNCLDYQSCETDDWADTLARVVLDAVIARALNYLPGYDDAPWEITPNSAGKLKHAGMIRLT